ncbi:MAG: LPS export ABC transporter permease LptG [Alphaproteobacteria bacterium]|nr:LPS export ABC transporter permease LptG [Alphaproteobacteria bacterium]
MRLPWTLSLYIGRQYLLAVLFTLLALLAITGLLDAVELIRRSASKETVTFAVVMEMFFFKLPGMAEILIPFAGLIGGMVALQRLTRTHELIVARAAGVSVWQFMMPALIAMFLFGWIFIMAYNPVAATMLARFEQLELKHFSGRTSMLTVSPSGLWLRQLEEGNKKEKEHIIHALSISEQGMKLSHVTIFTFDENAHFLSRIDADTATLENGHWMVRDALVTTPGKPAARLPMKTLDTDLTVSQIQDSFASPRTLSFWQLPGFIRSLEAAGFSALRHKMHWHAILSIPFLLCAMAFLAAAFSLRLPRRGRSRAMVVAGIFSGFLFFFISDIVHALGLSGSLPVQAAAWAPTAIVMLIGGAALLHMEDG